jgi:diguanylate cyclase (GGDEF)-like protein
MLTGLPNRLLLIDHMEGAIGGSQKSVKPIAIRFVERERFKISNESLGHSVGDRIIEEVAYRIKGTVSIIDTVARTSGDEYVVLVESITSTDETAVLAQSIIDKIHKPIVIDGERHTLDCSIGISMFPADGENVGSLLSQADTALYRAKEKGGAQFQFYQEVMGETINLRMRLMNAMHEALTKKEFIVYYQPQVDVQTGQIQGIEALCRWQRSDGTLMPPGDFLPIAEETGMIAQIGEQIIDKVCQQVAIWREKRLDVPLVAVNVSARQLVEFDIVAQFKQRLSEYGLPGSQLSVEITETAAMHDPEVVREILEGLKQLGIRLAIDDFGTGYSSLAYLKRFPIDTLKIDRAFIQGLPHDNENVLIVTGMMSLSRNFDLTVVAEGVEEPGQARFLRAQHCNKIQGFLYSKPLPTSEMERLLIEAAYFDPIEGHELKPESPIKSAG